MSQATTLNQRLWAAYHGELLLGATAPLAFIVRARTEADARALAGSLGGEVIWLKRKWWRLRWQWELAMLGRPVPLTISAIDQWSEEIERAIKPVDARLTHWVPAPAGA
jgi:hypothetical protein